MNFANENELQNKNPTIFSSKKLDQQIILTREKEEHDENISDEIDSLESKSNKI